MFGLWRVESARFPWRFLWTLASRNRQIATKPAFRENMAISSASGNRQIPTKGRLRGKEYGEENTEITIF